ncbi:MAG: prolipoprotein diacylglyceryl transferase [Candidatus Omnitrophica bacterium]|nr:prolipoprotein diacylglyceryl transferase [Candidatus Omnitrophota bacterium]
MYRYLLKFGWFTIYSYGAMLALAFLVGTILVLLRSRRYKIEPNIVFDLTFVIIISSLLGARLLFVVLDWSYYVQNPLQIFMLWQGGLVFYGGLFSAIVASNIFIKQKKLAFGNVADLFAPSLSLGVAIGRIGCFLNGCCWGKISYRFGICFPAKDNPGAFVQHLSEGLISSQAQWSLPVLPTQLYESVACLVIFFILILLEKHKSFDGFLFWLFVCLYSFVRFFIEGLRYYEPNFLIGNFTISQLISVVFFVVSIFVLYKRTSNSRFISGTNRYCSG